MAQQMARAVLQPRWVYSAQFQRLTAAQWDQLEAVDREPTRAITALPRIIPVVALQEHAQLNTLDEPVVHQCHEAQKLKAALCDSV